MNGARSLQPTLRTQEVKMSTIEIHRGLDIWVDLSPGNVSNNNYSIHMWSGDTLCDYYLPVLKLGHCDILCGFIRAKFTFPMYSSGNKIYL